MWGEGFKKPKMKQKVREIKNGHGNNGDWKNKKSLQDYDLKHRT
jgi:surface antigen